jgi:hypothetical protein
MANVDSDALFTAFYLLLYSAAGRTLWNSAANSCLMMVRGSPSELVLKLLPASQLPASSDFLLGKRKKPLGQSRQIWQVGIVQTPLAAKNSGILVVV